MERLLLTKGAILGVDFGDKRTGLATCDPSRLIATAIGVISPGGIEKTAEAVADEAEKRGVSAIVVGLPVNMDGSEGGRAARYRKFARLLEERLDEFIDKSDLIASINSYEFFIREQDYGHCKMSDHKH